LQVRWTALELPTADEPSNGCRRAVKNLRCLGVRDSGWQ
jgi:hypothetical protein